ncbi:hypothetical protein OX89_13145 [Diaphorobacter sp. J5-51]|nr:hypothetical protein OX89_13145 [Diaphorobacter sp. J5-51]
MQLGKLDLPLKSLGIALAQQPLRFEIARKPYFCFLPCLGFCFGLILPFQQRLFKCQDLYFLTL